jgi:hypothetical protein
MKKGLRFPRNAEKFIARDPSVTLETFLLDEKNHLNVKCELVNF